MTEKNRISILGCGWAGYPLAKALLQEGYSVKGSTTSPDKLLLMKKDGIDLFLVQLNPDIEIDREGFFDSDVLIVTIPPKKNPTEYLSQIYSITRNVHRHSVKYIIYFSSTSVYGNPNKHVDENCMAAPDTASGEVLKSIEDLLLADPLFDTTIVRFGGLVGPDRHPGRFLAGKTNISNGLAPVNLIHLDDCIGMILSILKNNLSGKVVNACSPHHPTRKDFYTLAAQTAGLREPQFIDELSDWKIVNSIYVPGLLNYAFKINDWTTWLLSNPDK